MINQDFLSVVFIVEPHFSVSSQEEIDGDVSRQRVQRRLPEACNDGALPLNGNDFWEKTLRRVDGRVVDLSLRHLKTDVKNDIKMAIEIRQ
jgi:hypothetical protein